MVAVVDQAVGDGILHPMNPVQHQLEELREAQRALHRLYVNTLYRMFAMESTLRALARQHPHPEELAAAVQRTFEQDAIDQLHGDFPDRAVEGMETARNELLALLQEAVQAGAADRAAK